MEANFLQPEEILLKLHNNGLLRAFLEDNSEKLTFKRRMFQFKKSEVLNLRPDEETNAILNGFVDLGRLAAFRSYDKDNTFFESLSLSMYNTCENAALIRMDIVLYMRQNFPLMRRTYQNFSEIRKRFAENPLVTLRNCVNNFPPNTLTLQAAANALNIELVSVFPPLNGVDDNRYRACADVFKPPLDTRSDDSELPIVYICWTGPPKVAGKRWRPARFVPLWPKRVEKDDALIIVEDEQPTENKKPRRRTLRSKREATEAAASGNVAAANSEKEDYEPLSALRNMLKDPAAKDPTAKDPTAKDPTAKDPTVKDPTVKDPTVKDPSKKPKTAKVRKKYYKKSKNALTPVELEATSIPCDVLDDQEDKDLRTNMTHCRRLYTVEEAYRYMLCCREVSDEVPKRLIINKQFIVRCEKGTDALEDGLTWTPTSCQSYNCILKPFTVLIGTAKLNKQLSTAARKNNLMKITKYEFKADWGEANVKVVFVIEKHPHLKDLKIALCQYLCQTKVLIPHSSRRNGTLNIYSYENNTTPPLTARLDPRPNTTSRYSYDAKKIASFTKGTI